MIRGQTGETSSAIYTYITVSVLSPTAVESRHGDFSGCLKEPLKKKEVRSMAPRKEKDTMIKAGDDHRMDKSVNCWNGEKRLAFNDIVDEKTTTKFSKRLDMMAEMC